VIYGNNEKGMSRVRTFKEGKLKISEDGLLEHDEKGIPVSGDVRNSWAGYSLLQALFIKEHNAVCDMLKVSKILFICCITWLHFLPLHSFFASEINARFFVLCLQEHYPDFDDEQLYRYARLVTSAVIAKIHTIDWTVELLKTDTLLASMRINW
jgi:alpha-dioxygenase